MSYSEINIKGENHIDYYIENNSKWTVEQNSINSAVVSISAYELFGEHFKLNGLLEIAMDTVGKAFERDFEGIIKASAFLRYEDLKVVVKILKEKHEKITVKDESSFLDGYKNIDNQ